MVIGQLLWQPFEVRFKNFLDRLEFHRKVLHLEVNLLHFKAHQSSLRSQAEEQRANQSFRDEARQYFETVKELKDPFSQTKRGRSPFLTVSSTAKSHEKRNLSVLFKLGLDQRLSQSRLKGHLPPDVLGLANGYFKQELSANGDRNGDKTRMPSMVNTGPECYGFLVNR